MLKQMCFLEDSVLSWCQCVVLRPVCFVKASVFYLCQHVVSPGVWPLASLLTGVRPCHSPRLPGLPPPTRPHLHMTRYIEVLKMTFLTEFKMEST